MHKPRVYLNKIMCERFGNFYGHQTVFFETNT